MKRIFSLFLASCFAVGVISAQQLYVGETAYTSLDDAVAAVEDGGTIVVDGEFTTTKRYQFSKNLTIKGKDENAKIIRGDANNIMFLDNSGKSLIFENITIDGGNKDSAKTMIEYSKSTSNALNNVKIVNVKNSANTRVIQVKSNGGVTFNGVTVTDCNTGDFNGDIFVGNKDKTQLTGNNILSVYCEKDNRVTAADLTNTSPISLYVDETRADGLCIVKGWSDASYFYAPAGELTGNASKNEITYAKAEKFIFIGENGYSSIPEAMEAAEEGAIIEITGEVKIGARLTPTQNVTIKGANEDAKLVRGDLSNLMLLDSNDYGFNICDITIDGGTAESGKAVAEFSHTSNNTLSNVKFINTVNTSNSGVMQVKANGGVTLEGVSVEDCTVAEGSGDLFVGKNSVTLKGDNSLSVYLENNRSLMVDGITNEDPILIITQQAPVAEPVVIVTGTSDISKFTIAEGMLIGNEADNTISVKLPVSELSIGNIEGNAECVAAKEETYSVNVTNSGDTEIAAADYSVEFYEGETLISTADGVALAAGESSDFNFNCDYSALNIGETFTLSAKIVFAENTQFEDSDLDNNASEVFTLTVIGFGEAPQNLSGKVVGSSIELSWNASAVTDNVTPKYNVYKQIISTDYVAQPIELLTAAPIEETTYNVGKDKGIVYYVSAVYEGQGESALSDGLNNDALLGVNAILSSGLILNAKDGEVSATVNGESAEVEVYSIDGKMIAKGMQVVVETKGLYILRIQGIATRIVF